MEPPYHKRLNFQRIDPCCIMDHNTRIFAQNADDFSSVIEKKHAWSRSLSETRLENAVILPLRANEDFPATKGGYLGGVLNEALCFAAGSSVEEPRFSCAAGYSVAPGELITCPETVVFGGIFYDHFGVMLLLSLTRFWWIVRHEQCPYRIIFLAESVAAESYAAELMKICHIPRSRYEILREPTRYAAVILPDEVLSSVRGEIDPCFMDPFRFMRDTILREDGPCECRKLYLSRRKYLSGGINPGFNEEYYENFFARRGFSVFHPQEHTLREQIRTVASADELVSTYGTLAHLASLFAGAGASQLMLLRSSRVDGWFDAEAAILELQSLNWSIVEATKNPYPTLHDNGVFLYYPTSYFRSYLREQNIPFEERELESNISDNQMTKYVVRWVECYSDPLYFRKLGQPSLFPVLQALYFSISGKKLDPKDYL